MAGDKPLQSLIKDRSITTIGLQADEAAPSTTAEWKPSRHETLIMITLSIISFMVALDACVIITSLSAIAQDLNLDSTSGFWIGTSYLLANAVLMPFIASLSDIFGRPICLWLSLLFFAVGTVLCCTAHRILQMLVGRSVQGVGGGGIVILSLVIFTDIVPLRYRPKYYGIVQGAWALGNCAGPVIGGVVAEKSTWRWIFYMMFPLCAFGLITVPFLLTIKPRTATMGEKLRRVDWTGGFIFICSATLFLIAISCGGTEFPWSSVNTLAPLVIGLVGLLVTFSYEAFLAKEPFLPKSLFNNASSVVTYACGAIQGLVIYGQLYYIPFYFLSVRTYSALDTGLALFPTMFTLVPASIITGALVTRLNNYRYPIWLGWAILAIATALSAFLFGTDTPLAVWVPTLVLIGLGHGSILNAQNFASQAMCAAGDEGRAAAMYGFLRQFGMALGVGIGGSAFQNVMALKLGWDGLPTSIASNSEAYILELMALPDGDPYKTIVLDAYSFGFRGVYLVYFGLSMAALLASLLIRRYDMNKELESEHTLHESNVSRMFPGRGSNGGPSLRSVSADTVHDMPDVATSTNAAEALKNTQDDAAVQAKSVHGSAH